jgi:hypothetical protein
MHIRSLFVLGGALLLIAANALAGPKDDVAAATAKWGETLGQDDPDKVLALYATDAVLWGTLSPTVRSDRAALRDYFFTAFKILPGLKVSFGEQLIRVYGNAGAEGMRAAASNRSWKTSAQLKPYRGPPMTLGTAAPAQVGLIVWCKACQHQVEPDPAEMAERCGADSSILDWRGRLVCSECGSREVDMVVSGTERR